MIAVDRPARSPRARGARGRLAWALLASLLIHLSMVGGNPSGVVRTTVPIPVRILEARLEHGAAHAGRSEALPAEVRVPDAEQPSDALPAQRRAESKRLPAEAKAGAQQATAVTDAVTADTSRPAPAPVDPVYYSARELDVYPAPLTPLRIGYPAHLANTRIEGHVLVNLLLDEAGTVDRVAVLAGEPPGYFDEHARAMLAAVRFIPGRREGRPVKSQVTVRVNFDPGSPEDAIR